MSIKDRIAAANDNASDDDGELEEDAEDQFDTMMDSFREADGEPRPAWERDELDDKDEDDEEEESSETPASTDNTPPPVEDDDEDDDDEDDEEEESVVTEPVVTVTTPAVEPESTPALDTLASVGFDTTGMTEAEAATALASEYRNIAQTWQQVQPLAQLGAQYQQHGEDFKKFLASQAGGPPQTAPVPEKKKEPPKPGPQEIAAEIQNLIQSVGQRPEYDPSWDGLVAGRQIVFDGRFYSPVAGASPAVAAIAEKMNTFRSWERKSLDVSLQTPTILARLAESVSQAPQPQGFTMEEVEAHFKTKTAEAEEKSFVNAVIERNSKWMFKHNAKGEKVIHPLTKNPIPTTEGLRYFQELAEVQRAGVTDSRKQHFYAIVALNKSLAETTPTSQTPSNDAAGSVPSVAPTPSASTPKPAGKTVIAPALKTPGQTRVDLMKTNRKRATRATQSQAGPPREPEFEPGKTKPRSVGSIMTEEFIKAGLLKPKKRKKDE